LPAERERSAEGAQVSSDEDRRKSAARLVAEAFREIAQLPPPDPVKIWATPPAPLIEATPVGAAAEGNGENAEAAVPVKIAHGTRPIPFAQRYGRRLNKHY
jgi:hypothetical protein